MPVVLLTILSFLYYFWNSSLLYFSLHTSAWDLGVFNQVLYNTAHGRLFAYSFRPFANYLGDHFSPILLILSPLALFESSIPLLFVQSLVLSLAGFVLYKLSKEIIGGRFLSLIVAFSFAFNPFTLQLVNFDFHPDSFFPFLFFSSVYFLVRGRPGLSLVSILTLQLVREDAFLLIFPLATVFFSHFKQRKLAFWILVVSLIYSSVVILYLMPVIRGNESSPLTEHYSYLGGNFFQIVLTVLTQPRLILGKLLGPKELTTLTQFFASTGFLSFFSPVILIASVPIFAAHLLSVLGMRITFQGHYPTQLLIVMFLALIFSLRFLTRHSGSRTGMVLGSRKLLALYLLVNTAASFVLFSPLPPSFSADVDRFTTNPHTRLFFQLKKMIPDAASLSAQTNLVSSLAFRRKIYEFPDLRKADYVFLDSGGSISKQALASGFYQMKDQLPSLGYELMKDEDGFQIYKRSGP